MEIKTCEQYVIMKLDFEEKKNEVLVEENEKLKKNVEKMSLELNRLREILGKYLEKDSSSDYLNLFIPIDRYGDHSVAEDYTYMLKYINNTKKSNLETNK